MDEEHKKLLEEQNGHLEDIDNKLGWAIFWLFLILLFVGC